MRIVEIYVQVDPLALRRNFEFLVMLYVREVRTDKHFRYVPVPELIGFLASVRLGLKVELLIGTNKQEVQVVSCPARAHFRAISRDSLSERVFLHEDGTCGAPEGQSRIKLQRRIFIREGALEYGLTRD